MPLHIRGRERGDRFRPFSEPGERRLKTFLIDARVPRWDRDRLPLVEAGREIVWVGGLRRGAQAPVTAATRHIVELTVKSLADSRSRTVKSPGIECEFSLSSSP